MLAAIYRRTGPAAEVLGVEECPTPEPWPGEVRVRLRVSGVNPTDWKSRTGGALTADHQIPNQDGAGDVDAVGVGVDPARIGERVWVFNAAYRRPGGTAAQWTCVPATQAVPLPDGADYDLGASLGIPAVTAHRALFADGPLDGHTVLVAGGAGAVGHSAIELAHWAGARVVTTVSNEEKAGLARAAGADLVVSYRDDDAAEQIRAGAPRGVWRVVELDLAANLALDAAVLADSGTVVTYASTAQNPTVDVRSLMTPNVTLRFLLVYTMPDAAKAHAVADVTRALADGALTTLPLHRFALSEIAAAHDAVQSGAVGKVLIDIP